VSKVTVGAILLLIELAPSSIRWGHFFPTWSQWSYMSGSRRVATPSTSYTNAVHFCATKTKQCQ